MLDPDPEAPLDPKMISWTHTAIRRHAILARGDPNLCLRQAERDRSIEARYGDGVRTRVYHHRPTGCVFVLNYDLDRNGRPRWIVVTVNYAPTRAEALRSHQKQNSGKKNPDIKRHSRRNRRPTDTKGRRRGRDVDGEEDQWNG